MPPKRALGSESNPKPDGVKVPKTDSGANKDFSGAVKKKLQTSSRTGQACDRCKVRKIKCDALPGGCSPCLQVSETCVTTDRITGRPTSRGYVENLEQQNQLMIGKLQEYESRLLQLGINDFKPISGYQNLQSASASSWNHDQTNANAQWGESSSSNAGATHTTMAYNSSMTSSSATGQVDPNLFKALPVFRAGLSGDNYCGVASGDSNLSSIRGTALSILGFEINIADFECPEMDTPDSNVSTYQSGLYNKSYQSFLQSAFGINDRLEPVELPNRHDGLTFAEWYMRTVNPYVPVLHKPTFITLLSRVYDDPAFKPTPAEVVMVHMVMAIMYYQYAARNQSNEAQNLNDKSNHHYHYATGHFYQLMASHTVQDAQALALICIHLRNFPKPGASWMVTNITFSLAFELGLNRSATAWNQETEKKSPLEIEMRKRIFWSILTLLVQISSKLGRPMPLRMNDFDIEVPDAIDDDLISDAGIDTSRPGQCAFRIGIEAMKLQPLFIEMYSTIYGVKRSEQKYIESVRRLDHELQLWRDSWPTELVPRSETNDRERRVYGAYLASWECKFKLLLHHPAQSLTQSRDFNTANMDICLEAATSMLGHVLELRRWHSLDTTWYEGATYTMAITTTLFGHVERSDSITTASLSKLREEMAAWLVVMRDLGELLGSGQRLHDAIHRITENTLIKLSNKLAEKTASAAVASANLGRSGSRSPIEVAQNQENAFGTSFFGSSSQDAHDNIKDEVVHPSRRHNYTLPEEPSMGGHIQTPYPAVARYTYPEPSVSSYHGPSDPYHGTSANAVVPNDTMPQAATGPFVFSNNTADYPGDQVSGGSRSWRDWTTMMRTDLSLNLDLTSSASALMQLGGRNLGDQGISQGGAPVAEMTRGMANMEATTENLNHEGDERSQTWPLEIFSIGHGGSPRL